MARSGALGGGSLNPFGSSTTDFGAFNVGASDSTKTVNKEESAALAFAIVRAQHDNGLMDDATYNQAQAAYLRGLDPTTQAGATAQYTIEMSQYTSDRNAIAQAVQTGQALPSALVQFDRNALGQVVQGSSEYMQRQDRLYSSEGQAFQYDERAMLDKLQAGYITNTQAQAWYVDQSSFYPDNFAVSTDIASKYANLQGRITGEQDNAMVSAFNAGTLSVENVLAYVAEAQYNDPGSQRSRDLGAIGMQAKMQAVEVNLIGRHDLTREYADLTAFINSAKTPKTGTSTKTRTYLNADGLTWRTVRTTSASPPSKASVAAYAKLLVRVAAAKVRQAEIVKEVGSQPGGWVTEKDIIAHLSQQQALVVNGSKQWWDFQHQIEAADQRQLADAAIKATGVRVLYPDVASEAAGGIHVGSFEVPVGAVAQIKYKQGKIAEYQARIDSGTLPEEEATRLRSVIATNEAAIGRLQTPPKTAASTAKTAATAARVVSGAARAPTVHGGGPYAPRSAAASEAAGVARPPAPAPAPARAAGGATNASADGPFQVITGSRSIIVPRTGAMTITTTRSIVPTNLDPKSFESFHKSFIDAIKAGQPSFHDNTTKNNYAIETDPLKRLDQMRALDTTWLNKKQEAYNNILGNPKSSPEQRETAFRAFNAAVDVATGNLLWVLDAQSPGYVTKYDDKSLAQSEFAAGLRADTKVTGKAVSMKGGGAVHANVIGFAVELLDVAERYVGQQTAAAQAAFDRGDYDVALRDTQLATDYVKKMMPKLESYATGALKAAAAAAPGGMPKGMEGVAADLKRLSDFGSELGTFVTAAEGISAKMVGTDANPHTGFLAVGSDGNPLLDHTLGGYTLKDGFVRSLDASGKVVVKNLPIAGQFNGKPFYKDKGNTIQVQMKIGTKFQPVIVDYVVGRIGSFTDASGMIHDVMGKLITDARAPGGYWTESPFEPGVAIPGSGNQSDLRFTMPANAIVTTAAQRGTTAGLDVPSGTELYSWTAAGPTGPSAGPRNTSAEFIMYIDPATGNAIVFQNVNGVAAPVSLVNGEGKPSDDARLLTGAGWGYDMSSLDGQQRSVLSAHSQFASSISGAFLGTQTPGDDLYKMTHPTPVSLVGNFGRTAMPRNLAPLTDRAAVAAITSGDRSYIPTAPGSAVPRLTTRAPGTYTPAYLAGIVGGAPPTLGEPWASMGLTGDLGRTAMPVAKPAAPPPLVAVGSSGAVKAGATTVKRIAPPPPTAAPKTLGSGPTAPVVNYRPGGY